MRGKFLEFLSKSRTSYRIFRIITVKVFEKGVSIARETIISIINWTSLALRIARLALAEFIKVEAVRALVIALWLIENGEATEGIAGETYWRVFFVACFTRRIAGENELQTFCYLVN
jgi:hypothetical protein